MPELPYGGLTVSAGAGTQALTTALAKFTGWGAVSKADSRSRDGDYSIWPDLTNNRVLVVPGVYEVSFDLDGTMSGSDTLTFQIFKNAVAVPDLQVSRYQAATNALGFAFSGILNVLPTDNPKTIGTFADPVKTSNPPNAGGYASAPDLMIPIEIYVKSAAGSDTLTIVNAHLTLKRLA